MTVQVVYPSRQEMLRCVARFNELKRVDRGLPDMHIEGYHKTFMSVLGFAPPPDPAHVSPFGNAVVPAIGHLMPGYGVSFIKCRPGNGVVPHTHDTYESFLIVDGRWRIEWDGDSGTDGVDLGPLDFICVPVGVNRRFECLEAASGAEEGTMLGIIGGDKPSAIPSPEAIAIMERAGPAPAALQSS